MTVHLVYPCAPIIKTPEAIGYNVKQALESAGYDVRVYRWDCLRKIKPAPGDILLGHAHANPFTVFQRSIDEPGWSKRILLLPFSHDPQQLGFLREIVPKCDAFLAITGKYWIDTLNQSVFSGWASRMTHVDLAVNREHFPRLKERFNEPGSRKFLYIGHSRFFKNTPYLQQIASEFGADRFGTIGCVLDGIKSYGKLDFSNPASQSIIKQYDFLIMTSVADPNPTTVLEAMSWGLIPIVTPQCGYYDESGIINIPLDNLPSALDTLHRVDFTSEAALQGLVRCNHDRLVSHFNWKRFGSQVLAACETKTDLIPISVTESDSEAMKIGERSSPNYPWTLFNIGMLLKPYLPKSIVKWMALRLQ